MSTSQCGLGTIACALALGGLLAACPACNKSSGTVTAEEVSYSGHASGNTVASALDNLADGVASLDERVTALEEAPPPEPVGGGNPGSSGSRGQSRGDDLEARVAQLEAALAERDQAIAELQQQLGALAQQVEALQNPPDPACPEGMVLTQWGICVDSKEVKGPDGSDLYVAWRDAVKRCGTRGARLCTAAEVIESFDATDVYGFDSQPDPNVDNAGPGIWVADVVPQVDAWADGFDGTESGSLLAAFILHEWSGGLDQTTSTHLRRFRCCYDP